MKFKITKKVLQGESCRLVSISACGDWLTNGSWAVRREKVEDGDLLVDQAAVSLKYGKLAEPPDYKLHEVGRVIPRGPWVKYERTRFATIPRNGVGMESIVYQGEGKGIAFVQRVNAEFFGPTLYASALGGKVHLHRDGCLATILAVIEDDKAIAALMPCLGDGAGEVAALKRALFGTGEPS